jgi:hypothetical protein
MMAGAGLFAWRRRTCAPGQGKRKGGNDGCLGYAHLKILSKDEPPGLIPAVLLR